MPECQAGRATHGGHSGGAPPVGLPDPVFGVVCENDHLTKDAARRADRGTRIPVASFANGMSKAAREVEIDASLAQPLTARVATKRADQQPVRDRSERNVLRAIRPGMDSGQPGA